MLTKLLVFALAFSLHLIATQSASLLDMGLGALGQLQHHNGEENGNGNGSYENGNGDDEDDDEEAESEEGEVNPFHKLNSMQEGEEFPYLWPKFPFVPGLAFPPSYPDWMLARRPSGIPDIARRGWPDISLPWKRPGGDDDDNGDDDNGDEDDSDEDIEECPEEGIKFISHPDNCEKYILCMDGEEVTTLECSDGLHFDRDTRTCADPEDAGCE